MVRITQIFTMDPADVWTPKDVFFPDDPFGINMIIQAPQELVDERVRFDLVYHMVNPGHDPYEPNWFSSISGDGVGYDTIDWSVPGAIFQWTNFGHWISWGRYRDPVNHVLGGDKLKGVFSLRGSISVQGSDLFHLTRPFAFNYKIRDD